MKPNWKVCILTAGIGSRIGAFADHFNKALLPVNGKAVICQIVEKFAEDVEIVVALGHKGEDVKVFLEHAYPDRAFTFVTVDRYTGEGSGPGYSLLQCRPHLECPFIYYSIDTIVVEDVPPPDRSWWGVGEVDDTLRFCSCKVDDEGKVIRIDDKNENDNTLAFNGLAGIYEYEMFWNALAGDSTLIAGELQVSNGYRALMEAGKLYTVTFTWKDSGTFEEYRNTQDFFKGKEF